MSENLFSEELSQLKPVPNLQLQVHEMKNAQMNTIESRLNYRCVFSLTVVILWFVLSSLICSSEKFQTYFILYIRKLKFITTRLWSWRWTATVLPILELLIGSKSHWELNHQSIGAWIIVVLYSMKLSYGRDRRDVLQSSSLYPRLYCSSILAHKLLDWINESPNFHSVTAWISGNVDWHTFCLELPKSSRGPLMIEARCDEAATICSPAARRKSRKEQASFNLVR